MNMNFQLGSCPVCGQMHDDGGWVTRETGERQFVCHDCLDSACDDPKELSRKHGAFDKLTELRRSAPVGTALDTMTSEGIKRELANRNAKKPRV